MHVYIYIYICKVGVTNNGDANCFYAEYNTMTWLSHLFLSLLVENTLKNHNHKKIGRRI